MSEISTSRESLKERLDRLPFTRRHTGLLAGSGVGWVRRHGRRSRDRPSARRQDRTQTGLHADVAALGVATGAFALAMSVGVLLVLRFIVELGLGAELPVASKLLSEFAPRRIRGQIVVILEAFWAIGWLGSAVAGFLIIRSSPDGG